MIYQAYLNKLPFKYCISILGGGGFEAMLFFLIWGGVQNSGKPAYIILARSLTFVTFFLPYLGLLGKIEKAFDEQAKFQILTFIFIMDSSHNLRKSFRTPITTNFFLPISSFLCALSLQTPTLARPSSSLHWPSIIEESSDLSLQPPEDSGCCCRLVRMSSFIKVG